MKKVLSVILLVYCMTVIFGCNNGRNRKVSEYPVNEQSESEETENKESEDGAYESLMMEYEMTRDPKLGYVPRNRLVKAYEDLMIERRSGRAARISALNWTERGPFTDVVGPSNGNFRGPGNNAVTAGRIRAIHVDLSDATKKTVWVGSVSGGLWKTTDITVSPASWTLVNDFLGNLAVASICQDPSNTQIMYFATGERNGNIDAVRGGGVWKSTNGGAGWSLLANTTSFWNASKIVCDAAGNVYVGMSGNGQGLKRSTDGGATWTTITPTTTENGNRITDLRISSTGRMHVTMGAGGSTIGQSGYFYVDNPATTTSAGWLSPVTPFVNYQYNCELAVAGNTLYVLPSNSSDLTPTVYKSTDGGVNWAPTAASPPSNTNSDLSINTGQGWYDLAIGTDPANPNVVIAGGLNFYKSDDGGASWTQVSRWVGTTLNYVHADHHAVVWNGNQVMVATDGGLFLSTDNGSNYIDRNNGLRIKQFYSCAIHPTTTNYFLGGTQDNGTHQLTTAGLGGSTEVIGGDGGFVHIDENEPQYQFGSTTRSQYRRSINGGASWSSVNYSASIGQFINPTDYDDVNNRMYASGSLGSYVRWENPQTGSTFTTASISNAAPTSVTSLKVSPYTNNRVFFASSGGRVVKVDDAHLTFPAVTNITGSNMPSTTVSSINMGTNDNNLIATFSNYGVQHVFVSTTGGGASDWTSITGNLPDIPVRWGMFYPEDNDKAIIATDMGIYETDDINGSSTVWVQNSMFPVVRTNMLQYRQRDGTVLAATHGRGLWTASLPFSSPYLRFASSSSYNSVVEATTGSGNTCRNYKDYTVNMRVDQAPIGTATATLNVSGGTAVQGVDYDFTTNGDFNSPSNALSFPNGSTAEQPITIRIYNDAEVENVETFIIAYTISGSTNVVAAPSSQSYTFTISDNDVAPSPVIYGGNFDLGVNEVNLTTQSPLRSNKTAFRIQYLYTVSELSSAGFAADGFITSMSFNVTTKNSTKPFNGFTISLGNTTTTSLSGGFTGGSLTQAYSANYTSVVGVNTFNFTTPFYWDGISNIVVNICFDNGALPADGNADVVDGTSAPLGTNVRACTYSDLVTTAGCSLGAAFISDVRIKTTFAATSGNPVASTLNTTRTEFVSNSGTYYFYNGFDIIARIAAASRNFECVTSTVVEAGNVWQSFFAGPRSQKVVGVNFVGTPQNSSYTLGVYVTAAELGGKDPNLVRLAGTSTGTMAGANSGNTNIYNTTVTTFGTGYLYTANVFGPGLYFLTEGAVTPVRDPSRQADFVKLLQNPVSNSILLSISNQSRQQIQATLFSNNGQLLQRWNLGRADGNTQLPINEKSIPDGVYILRIDAGNKTQSFKLIKQ